jgi:hypothetical protein
MKITRTIVIFLSVILFSRRVNGVEYDMNEINQKIKAITDKRLHLIETAIDEGNLLQSQEMLDLQGKCSVDWVQIISNLDKIGGGDEAKKLAIYGLGQLSAQNYMTAIERLVTKYESGLLTEKLIEVVLSPMGRMEHFVIDNFNHSRIIGIVNRIKVKSTNAALKNELNKILSGSDKSMRDSFREAHAGFAEGNTPIVILPP